MELLDRVYQKNPIVITRKIGDKIVLVPTQQETKDSEDVFTLNDMAAGIWAQIDGTTPLRTIKKRVLEKFEVISEQAEKDLLNFVLQLEESGMVFISSDLPKIDNK